MALRVRAPHTLRSALAGQRTHSDRGASAQGDHRGAIAISGCGGMRARFPPRHSGMLRSAKATWSEVHSNCGFAPAEVENATPPPQSNSQLAGCAGTFHNPSATSQLSSLPSSELVAVHTSWPLGVAKPI